jgi:hypothetical protein
MKIENFHAKSVMPYSRQRKQKERETGNWCLQKVLCKSISQPWIDLLN